MAARREAQAAQRRLKGDEPELPAIDLASEAHDRLAMLAKNCLRKRDNSKLKGDGRPRYHVRPALDMYVQMLWSSRAAETPSSAAAPAITSRACS